MLNVNLTAEEQVKYNALAGSFMAGLFRGASIALNVTGTALVTGAGVAGTVLRKTATAVETAGEVGGGTLIELGEKAAQKADEYSAAVEICNKILDGGAKPQYEAEIVA